MFGLIAQKPEVRHSKYVIILLELFNNKNLVFVWTLYNQNNRGYESLKFHRFLAFFLHMTLTFDLDSKFDLELLVSVLSITQLLRFEILAVKMCEKIFFWLNGDL